MAVTIVGIVLIVIALFILLFFLFRSDVLGFAEDKACKLSVLTRATVPAVGKNEVPLKCSAKKICLTSALFGGKCEQFAGEKVDDSVKLSGDAEKKADIIEETIASSMYSCWKTMGEGKLDLFSSEGFADLLLPNWVANFFKEDEKNYPMCVICSRIALDNDFVYAEGKVEKGFRNDFKEVVDKIKLGEHIENAKTPDDSGKTYLQAFTDKQVIVYPKEFEDALKKRDSGQKKAVDEIAILFMQVISDKEPEIYFNNDVAIENAVLTGVIIAGAAILIPGVGALIGVSGTLTAMIGAGGAAGFFTAVQQSEENAIAAGYCGELETTKELDGGKKLYGCSTVRPIDWDNVAELNRLCQNPDALYG